MVDISPTNSVHNNNSEDQDNKNDKEERHTPLISESQSLIQLETKSDNENEIPEDKIGGKIQTTAKHITGLWVPVTPQMIIQTLNRLRFLRFGPTMDDILINFKYHYPVHIDENQLMNEIKSKLHLAIDCGYVQELDNHYKLNKRMVINGKLRKSQINEFWFTYRDRQKLKNQYFQGNLTYTNCQNEFEAFMETDSDSE